MQPSLPHASERIGEWREAWRRAGRLVLLLDFDGTLSPIVERPELARPAPGAREAIEELLRGGALDLAVVSGRSLADARDHLGVEGIAYAGNHGMEIEAPGIQRVVEEAAAARPLLEQVAAEVAPRLRSFAGAFLEDKGLTLSIHYRMVDPAAVEQVRREVRLVADRVSGVRVTEGKMVLEVRPRVEWHKGRAVEFLLESFAPPPGAPLLYLGDDVTDEDAFRVLRGIAGGQGVLVSEETPVSTAALSRVRDPREVVALLRALRG